MPNIVPRSQSTSCLIEIRHNGGEDSAMLLADEDEQCNSERETPNTSRRSSSGAFTATTHYLRQLICNVLTFPVPRPYLQHLTRWRPPAPMPRRSFMAGGWDMRTPLTTAGLTRPAVKMLLLSQLGRSHADLCEDPDEEDNHP